MLRLSGCRSGWPPSFLPRPCRAVVAIIVGTIALLGTGTGFAQTATVPGEPVNLTTTAYGNRSMTLRWQPAPDNGSPITRYQVRHAQGIPTGGWTNVPGRGAGRTYPFSNLASGTSYTFQVRAINAIGSSSPASITTTTAGAPGAVRSLSANPANERAILRWDRPSSVGGQGALLIRYEYQQKAGSGNWSDWKFIGGAHSSSRLVTGLSNGTKYSFRVRAVNQDKLTGPDGSTVSTTPAPQFHMYLNNGGFRQGGDGVTATISVSDNIVLDTPQTFNLEWQGDPVNNNFFMRTDNPATITLPAGHFSASVVIRAKDTGSPYYNLPVESELVAKLGGTVIDSKPLTLYDHDSQPVVTLSTSTPSVEEGGAITLKVSLSAATSDPIHLRLSIANPNRRQITNIPTEFGAGSQGFRISANQQTKTYTIETEDNAIKDGDDKLTFIIARPLSGSNLNRYFTLGTHAVAVTVRDNEPADIPTIKAISNAANESGDPNKNAKLNFGVILSKPVNQTVTVDYRTANGGAIAGTDYVAKSGTLTFAPNEVRKDVQVEILEDGVGDHRETFRLWLDRETGPAVLTRFNWAIGTIYDEKPTLVVSDASVHESGDGTDADMNFKVHLQHAAEDATVTVNYATANGTAQAGSDYTAKSGTLTFRPGDPSSQIVTVPVKDDTVEDSGETFSLRLSNPTGGAQLHVSQSKGTGTILNEEAAGVAASFPASESTSVSHSGAEDRPQVLVAFSEAVATFAADTPSVKVTGGRVSSVQAHTEDGLENAYAFVLAPDGDGDVTFALAADAACASGGICTEGGTPLSQVPTARAIPGPGAATEAEDSAEAVNTPPEEEPEPEPEPLPPLTASFEGVPAEHDGSTVFTFQLRFSEDPAVSYKVLRDDAFSVSSGGLVDKARRVNGRDDLREIHIQPSGHGPITIHLPGSADCNAAAAICTADGRPLSNSSAATVRGLAALSVADAQVTEAAGATVDFVVSLSRAATGPVTVEYATADGSATAGADYTSASGVLTFSAGQTTKTVPVTVLDDVHDDDGETFTLRLSNAAGARIADSEATGTIENADPLPKGWLARFGRTSATQVVGLLDARFDEAAMPSSQLTLGGRSWRLSDLHGNNETPAAGDAAPVRGQTGPDPVSAPAPDLLHANPTMPAAVPTGTGSGEATPLERLAWGLLTRSDWSVDRRQFLSRSSFNLSLSALGGASDGAALETARVRETPGHWSMWGRGALTHFGGIDDGVSLDGDVLTGLLGVDYSRERWLAGVALAYNDGDGTYRASADAAAGTLASTLVSVHPYLRYALTDRLSAWGALGYGEGELRLRPERDGANEQEAMETAMQMRMGALGLRGTLFAGATTELALKSDLLWVSTASEATDGLQAVDGAAASRLRLLLSGRHRHALATGADLTPSFELGLRYDDGVAETGLGVELGGGLHYTDPVLGLTVETRARALLAHEDGGYEEWGLSGSLQLDPGRLGRGLSLRLDSGWGATESGADALWQRQDTAGLAQGPGLATPQGRIKAEWGYGLDVPWTHGLLTPYASVELAGGGSRTTILGWRFKLGQSLSLSLAGERRETAHARPEHGLMLRGSLPW